MKKTIQTIVMATLCLIFKAEAQEPVKPFPLNNQAVIGKVISAATGESLPAAIIKVTTTNQTIVSNDSGDFILSLSNGSYSLSVHYLNHKTKHITIQIPLKEKLVVRLENDDNNLEEVEIISTGYQNIPKERATGAFEQLNQSIINRKVGTDILSRLDGNSSVLFDKRNSTSTNLQIRGLYTLSAEISQPLIILDNFPYEGDINNINPNDVENVTILKDAAAASIWGARAGNGVIVINTKKGKANQNQSISFNANVTIIDKQSLAGLSVIPSTDFIELETFLFKQGAYNSYINNTSSRPALTPVVEILNDRSRGLISKIDSALQIDALRNYDVRNDFSKYMYRTQLNQQYQTDVSGGNDKSIYRFSAGYDKNRNGLIGDQYGRFTFSSVYTLQLAKNTSIESNVRYSQATMQNNSDGGFGSSVYNLQNSISSTGAQALPIYSRFVDENGVYLNIDKFRRAYIDTVGRGKLLDWQFNPLNEQELNDKKTKSSSLLVNAAIKHKFFSFLSAELRYQFQQARRTNSNSMSQDSYFTRNLINQFTNLKATSTQLKYPVPIGGIMDLTQGVDESHDLRTQINVNQNWEGKHQVNAIFGAEVRQSVSSSNSGRTYGYDQRLNVSNVDFVNSYPKILGSAAPIPYNTGYTEFNNRFISFFANSSYSYVNRYIFSGSIRNDATNLFGANIKNKWKPLWSAGAAWNISEEDFYKSRFLPYLKLRFTYGYQGNTNNLYSAYTKITYASANLNTVTNLPFATIVTAANPELRWESVRQINAAIDFSTKGNRISGSIDYYTKKSVDVISNETSDPTTGYATLLRNTASIKGNGLEFKLNSQNIVNDNFRWNSSLLFNVSKYIVSKYNYDISTAGFVSNGGIIYPMEGYNPYSIISYKWAGLDPANGNPRGYYNGGISSDWSGIVNNSPLTDQVLSGSALPLMYGNLMNSLNYKGFSFSFNMTFKFDYYFRRSTINYGALISGGYGHGDYLKRWQNPLDENFTDVPSFVYPNPNPARDSFYQYSEILAEKADHIRLQDIRLGYDLNLSAKKRRFLKTFQVYAYASDLNAMIWTANKKGIDPDFPTGLKPGKSIAIGIRTIL